MADLLTTTLAVAQPGLLHSCDTFDVPSATNDAGYFEVRDGSNNNTDLWLIKDRQSIMIGDAHQSWVQNATNSHIYIVKKNTDILETLDSSGILHHNSTHNIGGGTAKFVIYQTKNGDVWNGNSIDSLTVGTEENQLLLQSSNSNSGGAIKFATGTASPTIRQTIASDGNVGINTENPSEKLEVNGNIKVTGGLVIQDALVYWIDAVNGDDANAGFSLPQALATVDEALNRINNASGGDFEIKLVGFDNTSSGYVADNGYSIGVDCSLYNSTIKISGVKFDGTDLLSTDTEHDYPRLTFTTNSATERSSYGLWLNSSSAKFSLLRIVTPVWVGGDEVTDVYTDGLVKTNGVGFSCQFKYCRIELGDSPVVAGRLDSTVHCNFEKTRIIRSNTALTYTTNGQQSNGQDNSGTAGIPVYVTDHWENVYNASYGTKGLLTNFHQGSIYYRGDDVLNGQFGAYPSDDTTSYDYDAPVNNDKQEGEQNLFGNVDAQYTLTTDGSTAGKTPLNFNTNKFAGWYLY